MFSFIHSTKGKNVSFDIHTFIRSFYAVFNNIHSRAKALEKLYNCPI